MENAVSGAAYRPGDIVRSRKGLTVEIDNTDAEGRLILADALAKAGEGEPELIVDFATLTGAARTALGPDLPAAFVNDDELAVELEAAAREVDDPLWRLPLWDAYDDNLKSDIADIVNAAPTPMAGAHLCGPVSEALRPGRHRLGRISTPGPGARPKTRSPEGWRSPRIARGIRDAGAPLLTRMIIPPPKNPAVPRDYACNISLPYRFIGQLRGTSYGEWRQWAKFRLRGG